MRLTRSIDLTNNGDFLDEEIESEDREFPLFWVPRENRPRPTSMQSLRSPYFGVKYETLSPKRYPFERVFFPLTDEQFNFMQGCPRCGGKVNLPVECYGSDEPFNYFVCQPCEEKMNMDTPFDFLRR